VKLRRRRFEATIAEMNHDDTCNKERIPLPADLHAHTTSSDGRMSGPRLVEIAAGVGLTAIAIADHNAVSAVPGAQFAAPRWGVEVIAGAELDANCRDLDCHIVGLFLDLERPEFQKGMIAAQNAWRDWARAVLEETSRAAGLRLGWQDMYFWGDEPTGGDIVEALRRAGYDGPVAQKGGFQYGPPDARYIPMPLSPADVCDLIHRGGGVAILAHALDKFVSTEFTRPEDFKEFLDAGIDGWECWRSGYGPEQTEYLLRWAERLGLLPSGGSDIHGPYAPGSEKARRGLEGLGQATVPDDAVEALRARAAEHK
jgi:hypothetical protein